MSSTARFHPAWQFPAIRYLPGDPVHPKSPQGHLSGREEPRAVPLNPEHPEYSDFLRYALDLYHQEFFWESHIYLEAIWNAHQRDGDVAHFIRALIAIAAAGVKIRMHQPVQSLHHLTRAQEVFQALKEKQGKYFLGFDLDILDQDIKRAIRTGDCTIPLIPLWK